MLDRISTVQYTGGRSTPSTDLARERALQAQRQADTWQMDLHLCNSPSHKIQILLASARDHELQKLSHLLKQGCLSMGEHRKLRDDVRDAYAALAKESLQLLENTARRYSSNSSSNGSSSSSSSSSSPGRKESDSPALSTSPSAVTAAPLPSTPSTPSSVDASARERSLAVEGTYKQLVSMFSSLFPWSDTVLFDPSMCPPLFFQQQQQQQHLVQQQRPQRGGGGPLPPPPPPAFGHSGLGVLRSFQQIQNIAMQKVRLMMSNKQNRLQSAEHALEQWRWHKRSSSAAACSSGSSSSSSLSEPSEPNNDDDENEDDAGLLVHHNTNNNAEDEKDKIRRQQKKDGGSGGGGAITDDEADWRDHSTSVSPPNTTDPSTATPPSVLW